MNQIIKSNRHLVTTLVVTATKSEWTCSCPDYARHNAKCKDVYAVEPYRRQSAIFDPPNQAVRRITISHITNAKPILIIIFILNVIVVAFTQYEERIKNNLLSNTLNHVEIAPKIREESAQYVQVDVDVDVCKK